MMIGDKTPIEFIFQFIVLTQPILWITLYHSELKIPEQFRLGFYALSFSTAMAILGKQVSVGFYTTSILVQYVWLVCLSTYLYNQRYDIKQAISLGFLTVFVNSFYWELPLHIAEVLQYGFHVGQLVQLWRLFPLLFFFDIKRFTRESVKLVAAGLVFSFLMITVKMQGGRPLWVNACIYAATRTITTATLTKTITEAPDLDSSRTG